MFLSNADHMWISCSFSSGMSDSFINTMGTCPDPRHSGVKADLQGRPQQPRARGVPALLLAALPPAALHNLHLQILCLPCLMDDAGHVCPRRPCTLCIQLPSMWQTTYRLRYCWHSPINRNARSGRPFQIVKGDRTNLVSVGGLSGRLRAWGKQLVQVCLQLSNLHRFSRLKPVPARALCLLSYSPVIYMYNLCRDCIYSDSQSLAQIENLI